MSLFDTSSDADAISELQANILEIVREVKKQSDLLTDLLRRLKDNKGDLSALKEELAAVTERVIVSESKLEVFLLREGLTITNVNGDVDGDLNAVAGDQNG